MAGRKDNYCEPLNELAREYAATKAELEALSQQHSQLEIDFALGVLTDALARCQKGDGDSGRKAPNRICTVMT
jgi:hypothetical protein